MPKMTERQLLARDAKRDLNAAPLGVSVRTLQQWEQGRREPRGAARTLVALAAEYPGTCGGLRGSAPPPDFIDPADLHRPDRVTAVYRAR